MNTQPIPKGDALPTIQAGLDHFTQGYIECALWSSVDGDGEPLDDQYSATDIAPETLAQMITECAAFQEDNATALADAYANETIIYDEERAGHDFWLTRNGHGAGFWDRGLGATGETLSDAARSCGSIDLYIGDDGQVYA